jgi:hypothetical protein
MDADDTAGVPAGDAPRPLARLRRLLLAESTAIRWWCLVVAAEIALVTAYLLVTDAVVTEPRYVVYPFVWMNVGVWAMVRIDLPDTDARSRRVATAVAAGYFLLLSLAGGVLLLSLDGPLPGGAVASVHWGLPPGWGPTLVYGTPHLRLSVVPFKFVGYVAMTYLVYARLLDATRAVLSGVLGLVSCVGCTFSLLLPLLGATALFGSTLTGLAWDLSTLVFLLTVALLYWADEAGAAVSRRL